MLIRAVGQKKSGDPTDELRNFPWADLQTIDGLWKRYSDGQFGFSVQKEIWQKHGNPTSSGAQWDQFCVEVGWQLADASRFYGMEELKADPQFSPRGEFPRSWVLVSESIGFFSTLASRFVNSSS